MSRARYMHKGRGKSLSKTLMFAYSLMYVVFIIIVASLGYYYYQKIIVEEKNNLYEVISSLVSESIDKVSYSGRYHSKLLIEELVDKNSEIVYIVLYDQQENPIASAGINPDKVELNQTQSNSVTRGLDIENGEETIAIEEISVDFSGGFMDRDKGYIRVGISKEGLSHSLNEGIVVFGTVFLLLLVFGLYVLYVISRYYGDPIKRLAYEFEGVLEFSPLLIVFYGRDGKVVEASRNFISSFSLELEEESIYEIMQRYSVGDFAKEDESVFLDEQILRSQSVFYTDEEEKVFQVIKFPALKSENGVELVGAILNDITSLIQREDELKKNKEALEELNTSLEKRVEDELLKNREKDELVIRQSKLAAMGEMSSNIAHNWRQPLAVLGGVFLNLSDAYEDGSLSSDYFKKEIDIGESTLRGLSKTIDNFRDFFKPEGAKSAFVIHKEIDKALDFIGSSLQDNSIEIEYEPSLELASFGYPAEFSQVVLNILTNAKEALKSRGIKNPNIKIRVFKEDNVNVIEIEDNAGGVEPENVDRIFEPYFSTKSVESGAGFGLFMSKIMIEKNMGGTLSYIKGSSGAIFRIEVVDNEQ
ncbi:MAG: sensor histidine kinase [Campylobacterales bacterium]